MAPRSRSKQDIKVEQPIASGRAQNKAGESFILVEQLTTLYLLHPTSASLSVCRPRLCAEPMF